MTDVPDIPVRVRPEIAALPPYKQGRQAGADAFKLSSNENPFDPLPGVVEAVRAATPVNRYPDASAARLRERLAERFGVASDEVHIGAGSVSILAQLDPRRRPVPATRSIYAWRSFEAYPWLAVVAGATAVEVPLTEDARHDLPAMAAAITDRTRAIIVCSPNNPTGPIVTQAEFDEFVEPGAVRRAGHPRRGLRRVRHRPRRGRRRCGCSAAATHPNVVVLRTFSKAFGLAGLRVGYAIGHTRILDAARSTSIPLSVTAQAENAALASLDAEEELLDAGPRDRRAPRPARRRRCATRGWRVPDAQGNFVWLPTGDETLAVAQAFDEAGLIVRPFAGDGIRISVGEEESVEKVLRIAGIRCRRSSQTGTRRTRASVER